MSSTPHTDSDFEDSSKDNFEEKNVSDDTTASDQQRHRLEAGIGAATGGVVGALVGNAVGGKAGGVVGALAGAITVGLLGEAVGDDLIALEQQAAEVLGEAAGEDELPAHYSWAELQALSKSQ